MNLLCISNMVPPYSHDQILLHLVLRILDTWPDLCIDLDLTHVRILFSYLSFNCKVALLTMSFVCRLSDIGEKSQKGI